MPVLRPPAAALIVLGACSLTGCGGAGVDAAALKTQLTGVADALDRCVAETADARRCTAPGALGELPDGTELGAGIGQVQVKADRALRYELIAEAGDDVRYRVVAQPVGARKRVCLPAGRGDCPDGGAW